MYCGSGSGPEKGVVGKNGCSERDFELRHRFDAWDSLNILKILNKLILKDYQA